MALIKCNCDHSFQDKKYGQGVRVATLGVKDRQYSCTVCSSRVSVSDMKQVVKEDIRAAGLSKVK